jgi:hypothetical protein
VPHLLLLPRACFRQDTVSFVHITFRCRLCLTMLLLLLPLPLHLLSVCAGGAARAGQHHPSNVSCSHNRCAAATVAAAALCLQQAQRELASSIL